ncbi:MAG: ATP-grasp domain-containing protein, partial [Sphingobacteriales bacterium]
LESAGKKLGFPLVIKPLMSSSGKGQSVARTAADLSASWKLSQEAGRAGAGRVIAEEFIPFDSEITLLTIRTQDKTLFCDPIGHKQKDGDYIESWQPHPMSTKQLEEAKHIVEIRTAETRIFFRSELIAELNRISLRYKIELKNTCIRSLSAC